MIDLSIYASVFFVASGIPQIIKLIKTKSSADISVGMYLLTFTGVLCVLTGAEGGVFFSNFVSLIIMSLTLILIIKYKA